VGGGVFSYKDITKLFTEQIRGLIFSTSWQRGPWPHW